VIAVTAYSEPIPVDVHINEPPQVHEEENNEHSNFAELLASLLQGTQSINDSIDHSSSGNGLDELSIEKTQDVNKLNIFANAIEDGSKINSAIPDGSDIDLSDAAINKEYQNILSADYLFNSSLNLDDSEDINSFSQEFDADTLNRIAELMSSSKTELSAKDLNSIAEKLNAASELAAKQNNEENLSVLNSDKNRRTAGEKHSAENAVSKNEKTETLSKNKSGDENAGSLNNREDNRNRLDEFRRSRRDRLSFEVRDLRTGPNNPNNADTRSFALAETAAVRVGAQTAIPEVTLDLRLPGMDLNSRAQTSWEAKAGTAVENMLARELQNFNGDIVRHASMVLREGGVGTIKIALHPETLGNVKIRLELTDNKIVGHIIVESQEALNAFRKELSALEQAFKDSGFAEASLDLSFTADGAGTDGNEFEENSFALRTAASNYEDSFESQTASIVDVLFGQRQSSINMLA
jgi:flagellar hook-length control protein FliK